MTNDVRPPRPTEVLQLPWCWWYDPFRSEWRKARIYY